MPLLDALVAAASLFDYLGQEGSSWNSGVAPHTRARTKGQFRGFSHSNGHIRTGGGNPHRHWKNMLKPVPEQARISSPPPSIVINVRLKKYFCISCHVQSEWKHETCSHFRHPGFSSVGLMSGTTRFHSNCCEMAVMPRVWCMEVPCPTCQRLLSART